MRCICGYRDIDEFGHLPECKVIEFRILQFGTEGLTPALAFLAGEKQGWPHDVDHTMVLDGFDVAAMVNNGTSALEESELLFGATRELTVEEIAKALRAWWAWYTEEGAAAVEISDGLFTITE